MQMTDLHMGDTTEDDEENERELRIMLEAEMPDLVVFTGDQTFMMQGETEYSYEHYWSKVATVLTEMGIKWALTLGNHDEELADADEVVLYD